MIFTCCLVWLVHCATCQMVGNVVIKILSLVHYLAQFHFNISPVATNFTVRSA